MALARQEHPEPVTVRIVVRRPDPLQSNVEFDAEPATFVAPLRLQLRHSRLGCRGSVTFGQGTRSRFDLVDGDLWEEGTYLASDI
jgi:hypothetical protein